MLIFALLAGLLLLVVLTIMVSLWSGKSVDSSAEPDPEWQVFLAKRNEIESDALLEPHTRQSLRDEWSQRADEVLSRRTTKSLSPTPLPQASRSAAYRIAGLSGLAAVILYLTIGQYQSDALALNWSRAETQLLSEGREPPPPDGAKHPGDDATLEDRIASLEKRLQDSPGDLGGWVLLARSRGIQRDFAGSAAALEKALLLAPGHPDLLADLADTIAMTANKSLAGRPSALIQQVLQADPDHQKGLSLAATAAMQRSDVPQAAVYLRRLRATLSSDSPEIMQIDAVLASFGGAASASAAAPASNATSSMSAKSSAVIEGRIELSASLLKQLKQRGLPDSAVLFVIARSPGGPPMPVAVARLPAAQIAKGGALPFTLDDSSAMSPASKLSTQKTVNLEARISLSGTAGKQSGDLIGIADGVAVGTRHIKLAIQSVLP